MSLKNRTIILGVAGGIALHRSLDLASQLVKMGTNVHVVMTENATRLIQPLQFQIISRNPVMTDLFDLRSGWKPPHIDLADSAHLLAIVPATANIIGKIANGIADDVLSTVAISVRCPLLIAPAMNGHMLQNPMVQENINKLSQHTNFEFVDPAHGSLACGYEGIGRLSEVSEITDRISEIIKRKKTLSNKKFVVTAGPTREHIDPVRFITNRSSGKMGYAIAEVAKSRGAEVTLLSGKVSLKPPAGVDFRTVETAQEMRSELLEVFDHADVVVMAAAIGDYRPTQFHSQKIKKTEDFLVVNFEKNADILSELGSRKDRQILVGFAAETENIIENAREKMVSKNLELIVANDISADGAGFEWDTNIATIIDRSSQEINQLPKMTKLKLANYLVDLITDKLD